MIEVLVVVAIIALLIAILLPSLSRARAQARNTVCLSGLHQFSLGIMAYASLSKGKVPGQTGHNEEGWAHIVARQFQIRPKILSNGTRYIPVETLEVFHCPERHATARYSFLDYVHNTLDPAGPAAHGGSWAEAHREVVNIDGYRRPGDVAFICEAEREDKVPNVTTQGGAYPTVWAAAVEWAKYRNAGVDPAYGIDVMDIRHGAHVPQGYQGVNTSDAPGLRRAARRMHLDRFTNSMFLDGHAAGIPLATFATKEEDSDTLHKRNFAYWLRLFGLNDPEAAANVPPSS